MSKKTWTDTSVHLQTLLHSNASPQAIQNARERLEDAQRSYWNKAKALAQAVLEGTTTVEEACEASGVTPEDLGEAFRMLPPLDPPMADPEEEEATDASDAGDTPGSSGTTPAGGSIPFGSLGPSVAKPAGAEPNPDGEPSKRKRTT